MPFTAKAKVVKPAGGRRRCAAVVDLWDVVQTQLSIAEASGFVMQPGPIQVMRRVPWPLLQKLILDLVFKFLHMSMEFIGN